MVSRAIVLVLFFFTHSLFTWAALVYLKVSDEDARRGKKLVSLLGGTTLLLHLLCILVLPTDSFFRLFLASILFVCSAVLFIFSIRTHHGHELNFAFTQVVSKNLVTTGPYSLVRHPLYTSYILAWVAGVLASNLYLIVPTIGMFVLYFRAAKHEEETLLKSQFGEEYRSYVARTKMFIPFVF